MASATTISRNDTHIQIDGKIYRVLKMAVPPSNGTPIAVRSILRREGIHKSNLQNGKAVVAKVDGGATPSIVKMEGESKTETINKDTSKEADDLQPRRRAIPEKLKDFIVNPQSILSDIKEGLVKSEQIDDDFDAALGLTDENDVTHKCTICKKTFALKGNLKAHMRIHSDSKPFACTHEGCGMAFRTKQILKQHLMVHMEVKPWTCWVCKRGFSSKVALKEHESRHMDTKLYKCPHCDQKFRQNSCLSRHLLRHSDEKGKYTCHVCTKTFKMAIYLKMHMKVHTGERPFTCDVCGKSFAHKHDLNRHKIIHTGNKPYVCATCGQRFNDGSSRRRHEREHDAATKRYSCPYCEDTFKRANQLKAHCMRKHHVYGEQILEKTLRANSTELLQVCMPVTIEEGGTVTTLQPFVSRQPSKSTNTEAPNGASINPVQPASDVPTNTKNTENESNQNVENTDSTMIKSGEEKSKGTEDTNNDAIDISDVSDLIIKTEELINSYPHTEEESGTILPDTETTVIPVTPSNASVIQRVTLPKLKGQTVALDTEALLDQVKDQMGEQTEAVQMSCSIIEDLDHQQIVEVRYHFVQPNANKEKSLSENATSSVLFDEIPVETDNTAPHMQAFDSIASIESVSNLQIIEPQVSQTNENIVPQTIEESVSQTNESLVLHTIEPQVSQTNENLVPQTIEESVSQTSESRVPQTIEESVSQTNEELISKTTETVESQSDEETVLLTHENSETPENDMSKDSPKEIGSEDPILISTETKQYSSKPDFCSQGYYNWLTAFSEACKSCSIPLSQHVYATIALVKTALVNIMAEPSGVLANKENFHILISILKDLTNVIEKHLEYVLSSLSD